VTADSADNASVVLPNGTLGEVEDSEESQEYNGPEIVEAKYGDKDISDTLKKFYMGGLRSLKAIYSLWGDSDSTTAKVLKVTYKSKDSEHVESTEGDAAKKITLPDPVVGPPEKVWAVVWHVTDHAECETFLTEEEAKEKYDELNGGSWAARLYTDEMTCEHEYGSPGDTNWDQCRDMASAKIVDKK
jgi:hypothetical protein